MALFIFPPITLSSSGLATEAKQDTIIAELDLDVVDTLDTNPVLDASSTTIPASASLPLEVVASLADAAQAIRFGDTTGFYIGVFTGAAASEVLKTVINPGSDSTVKVNIPASTRISIRHMQNSTITNGELLIEFLG